MTDLQAWPDIEAALVTLLADLAAGGTVTPSDLENQLPYLRVQRYGGQDDRITDTALVSVDAFAATRGDAFALAEQVRQRILDTPHVVGGTAIDWAETVSVANDIGWSNSQTLRRFTRDYRVTFRR